MTKKKNQFLNVKPNESDKYFALFFFSYVPGLPLFFGNLLSNPVNFGLIYGLTLIVIGTLALIKAYILVIK